MTRIIEFCDGAERGDISWWTTGAATVSDTAQVHGSYCYALSGGNSATKALSSALGEFYLKFYIKFNTSNVAAVIRLRKNTTSLVTLTHNIVTASLDITGATTGNTGGDSVSGNWQCLEIYYLIDNTAGELTIKLDGLEVFTFTGDTQPGADTTVDNISFSSPGGSGSFYLDDFALDNASWCGLGYYIGLTANGAGDTTQWAPTGGANYANVGIPANDSTFNTGTTGQLDNYAMTSTTIGAGSVLRVIPWARVNNSAGGSVNIGLKTGGTDYTAAVTTPTSLTWMAGNDYTTSPATSLEWSQSDLDSLQFTVSVP